MVAFLIATHFTIPDFPIALINAFQTDSSVLSIAYPLHSPPNFHEYMLCPFPFEFSLCLRLFKSGILMEEDLILTFLLSSRTWELNFRARQFLI
jgi:hypothetical protein